MRREACAQRRGLRLGREAWSSYQRTLRFTAARRRYAGWAERRAVDGGTVGASYNVVRPGTRASIPVPIAAYTPVETRNIAARLPGQLPPRLSPGQSEMPPTTTPMATPTMAPIRAPLRNESPRLWIRLTRAASNRRSAPPTRSTSESGFTRRSVPEVSISVSSRTYTVERPVGASPGQPNGASWAHTAMGTSVAMRIAKHRFMRLSLLGKRPTRGGTRIRRRLLRACLPHHTPGPSTRPLQR
jgi:hypothetical protein